MGWEVNGVRGTGDRPALAGNFNGTLLVAGSGSSVWEDLERAPGGDLMACNHMAFLLDRPVAHAASLHANIIPAMRSWRSAIWRHHGHTHMHSVKQAEGVDAAWFFDGSGHSFTGMFAATVGLALGYGRIVLCGCPQDDSGYVWRPGCRKDHANRGAFLEWEWWRDNVFRGRVRSMSGRTRDWLGAPDGL